MSDPAKYWPGGVPEHIQCHPAPVYEGLEEEVKGYAPGYLDCEEAGGGMAYGYDDARLRTDEELEGLPFEDDELAQNGAFEPVPPLSTPEPRPAEPPRGSSRTWLDVVL